MTMQLPQGRVGETAQRDLLRALVRSTDSGPARPTKTVAPPSGFAAMRMMAAEPEATAEPGADWPPLMLPGGWSLTTDESGSLIALHEDGSSQVLATRSAPAGKDNNDG